MQDQERNALSTLYVRKDGLFAKIEEHIARSLGVGPVDSLSECQRREIAEEPEELTENWDMANVLSSSLSANSELQKPLQEHHEVCERIMDIRDTDLDKDD